MTCKRIDFNIVAGRVYVGRQNGQAARTYFKVAEYDKDIDCSIEVIFPDNARTLASSFFLGMFGDSVREAGCKEAFLKRFKFKANEQIMKEIEVGISEALSAGK